MAKSAGLSPLRILIVVHRAQLQLKRKLGDPANFGAHKRRVQDNKCFRRRRAEKSGAPACRRHAQSDIQRVLGRNPLPSILLGLIHMLPETFYFSWTIGPANHHLAYDQRKARSTIPNLGLLTVSADRKLTCFG